MKRTLVILAALFLVPALHAQTGGKTGLLGQYFKNPTLTGSPASSIPSGLARKTSTPSAISTVTVRSPPMFKC